MVDKNGNEVWNKTFGGTNHDISFSVEQTSDKGYILTGYTWSFGAGEYDAYLIKTDENGNEVWSKTFGGTFNDVGYSVKQTNDSGYIVAGYTWSYGMGNYDFWLIKTDEDGNELWNKTYGGTDYDECYSVEQTNDNGYIMTGYTKSYGAGNADILMVKADQNGSEIWSKTFGGIENDGGYSVDKCQDGGYVITGYASSFSTGEDDIWIIKTDSLGNQIWEKTLGGILGDCGFSIRQTLDGGYIVAGYTFSYGAGDRDFWLIKLEPGLVGVNNKVDLSVKEYCLYQNYPNPFNPATTIKYEIPFDLERESIDVMLKIYDVLGREVLTLVDEDKQPGIYSVILYAQQLKGQNYFRCPSGIYFYRIQIGNKSDVGEGFVEIKKMLHIK